MAFSGSLRLPAQLRPHELHKNVRDTGRILGHGNFGSVHELEIDGQSLAGKQIYEILITDELVEQFYDQCTLLSQLRHPHIVLFAGMCYLPGQRLPLLVMEKLQDNLGHFLKTIPNITLSVKLSILNDIASGLAFLHHTLRPGVIHGNLTSRAVLVNEAMTAKIAGMDCVHRVDQGKRPGAPGPPLYMPPEAFTSRYSLPLDMFSFGHLSLYVAIQTSLVGLLPKTYMSPGGQAVRTELERRRNYFGILVANLRKDHVLVGLIQQCLHDEPTKRPTAVEALMRLTEGKTPQMQLSLEMDKHPIENKVAAQKTESTAIGEAQSPLTDNGEEEIEDPDNAGEVKEDTATPLKGEEVNEQQDISLLLIGEEARRLYEEAMTSGYIESALALLVLVGVMGSGKSLFKRLVLGLPVPDFSPSTALAESSVRSMSVSQVVVDGESPVPWRIVESKDMMGIVAEASKSNTVLSLDLSRNISQLAFNSSSVDYNNTDSEEEHEDQNPSDSPIFVSMPQPVKPKCEKSTAPFSTVFLDALKELNVKQELMQRMSEPTGGMKLMDINFFYILDSGGQPPFREMLSHFVQESSAFVLMQKLNERLDFKPPVKYRVEGKEDSVEYPSQLTNEQTLHQYFQAVQSHNSKVFVVGTFRDLEHECDTEPREQKNQKLLDAFQPVLGDRLVLYKVGDPDQLMFPVNCTSREPEDLATAQAFREAVMKLCLGKKVKIPLPWFMLEQLLRQLAKKMQQKVLSIEECYEVAHKILFMCRDACKAAIEFLGRLNILFYRPSVLPDVVFCDAQVILDMITGLVRYSHELKTNTTQSLPPSMQSGGWLKFRDFGQIDSNMLEECSTHYRDGLFTAPKFLELLEDLLIAGKLENGKHFMPSILPDLSLEEVTQYRISSAEHPLPMTIYYTINSSRVWLPVGVVPSLVVYLQNHYKWKPTIKKQHGGKPACMYHNCMQFALPGGKAGSVTLIDSTKYLEIHIKAPLSVASQLCPRIRSMVFSGLKEAHKSLHYDLAVVEDGVLCSGQCGNKQPHLATLDEARESWKCSEDEDIGDDLNKGRQALWFVSSEDTEKGVTKIEKPTLVTLGVLKTANGREIRVIQDTANHYNDIGTKLLNDVHGERVDTIKSNENGNGENIIREVYKQWMKEDVNCSWATLTVYFRDCGLNHLALAIEQHFGLPSPPGH